MRTLRYFLITLYTVPLSITLVVWFGAYSGLFRWLGNYFDFFFLLDHYARPGVRDFGAWQFAVCAISFVNAYYVYKHPPLDGDSPPLTRLRCLVSLWLKVKEAEMAQRASKPKALG